jgi:hypothetical protein
MGKKYISVTEMLIDIAGNKVAGDFARYQAKRKLKTQKKAKRLLERIQTRKKNETKTPQQLAEEVLKLLPQL